MIHCLYHKILSLDSILRHCNASDAWPVFRRGLVPTPVSEPATWIENIQFRRCFLAKLRYGRPQQVSHSPPSSSFIITLPYQPLRQYKQDYDCSYPIGRHPLSINCSILRHAFRIRFLFPSAGKQGRRTQHCWHS